MRIVILMGGVGARFASAGYTKPKPLLRIDGKAMVEHVVAMYSGDNKFIFVCNEKFADDAAFLSLVKRLPHARVVSIPSHKRGPVHSLSLVWNELPDNEAVLVSYSDFNAGWDFVDFKNKVETSGADGAVPSYTGFHPHLLHQKKYAGIIADARGKMEKIREKHSFTERPEDSFHSAGNYYFASAGEMKRYGEALIQSGESLGGEYYMSMIYPHYLADRKYILVHPFKYFLQWGTPEDLEEYEAWSQLIQGRDKGVTEIPDNRRARVTIPYRKDSPEYKKSLAYWKEYFST